MIWSPEYQGHSLERLSPSPSFWSYPWSDDNHSIIYLNEIFGAVFRLFDVETVGEYQPDVVASVNANLVDAIGIVGILHRIVGRFYKARALM